MRSRWLAALALSTLGFALVASADGNLSYVFRRGDRSHLHANGPVETAMQIARKWDGDFIWAKANGHQYLIRDAAVLAQASGAFRELDAFQPVMQEAEQKVAPFEERMDEIEQRMDDLSDQLDDDELSEARRHALEAKLHEVEQEMHGVESRMSEVERQLESIERQMDAREQAAEAKLEGIIRNAIRSGLGAKVE